MNYLIKNAEIWESDYQKKADIYIEDGIIKEIGTGIKKPNAMTIEAEGHVLLPLFIDLHSHLRVPGEEEKEDLESGLSAALKGGYGAVVCMPNTKPPVDTPELVAYLKSEAQKINMADLHVAAAITTGLEGNQRTSFKALCDAGACAFSDDGKAVNNTGVLLDAMLEAQKLGKPLFLHEEDYGLSRFSCINEGAASYLTGISGNIALSESIPAYRDIVLANKIKAKIHIQHVSSKETVEVLKQYRIEGITAEVTPHHLLFDEEKTLELNPLFKTNPPLRSKSDREALLEALKEGWIDCIATDHAPHTAEEKSLPYELAPSGMAWFELVFPALYTYLILKDLLKPEEVLTALNVNPARILNVQRPEVSVGKPANFSLFNVSVKTSLKKLGAVSKGKNNPLFETELYGFAGYVFKDGKLRIYEGKILGEEESLD